ncbi:MAG: C39 family peptidase [Clostridia bacterium]|nr:C39 family peptidase [Clostridia bacterium]
MRKNSSDNRRSDLKRGSVFFSIVCAAICCALILGAVVFVTHDFGSGSSIGEYESEGPTGVYVISEASSLFLPDITEETDDFDDQGITSDDSGNDALIPPSVDKKLNSLENNQDYYSYYSEAKAKESKAKATTTKAKTTTTTRSQTPATTKSSGKNGLTILSTKVLDLVYYCQVDPEYKNVPYGSNTLGGYGCGPTNMAMVISTLSKKVVSPIDMAKWAVAHGHYVKNRGTSYAFMTAAAKEYGVKVSTISKSNKSDILNALKSGKILLTVMKAGHFTRGSHFMIIRGVTDSGKLLVADSGSYARSVMEWDYSTVMSEVKLSYFWVYG